MAERVAGRRMRASAFALVGVLAASQVAASVAAHAQVAPAQVAPAAAAGATAAPPAAAAQPPRDDAAAWTDEDVDALAGPLVRDGWVTGLSVALCDGERDHLAGYGRFDADDARAVGSDTVYEIGSVSKVFTGVLLALAVQAGEVTIDEPVAHLLPPEWNLPDASVSTSNAGGSFFSKVSAPAAPITLLDLTMHTSGLGRVGDPPYAYSNFAVGLLGFALANRAGTDYASLLRARVAGRLGLDDTRVTVDPEHAARLAPGHDAEGRPVGNWSLATLAGAGGVRSTAADMLAFAKAALGRGDDPVLRRAFALSMVPRRPADADGTMVAFGWHVRLDDGLWIHSGQTGGYHAFLAVAPERDQAVVVLSNTATGGVSALGERLVELLAGRHPAPLDLPAFVSLDEATLAEYVGRYANGAGLAVEVTLTDDALTARFTEPEPIPIHATARDEFIYRLVAARLSFTRGDDGAVRGVVLHQFGRDLPEMVRLP